MTNPIQLPPSDPNFNRPPPLTKIKRTASASGVSDEGTPTQKRHKGSLQVSPNRSAFSPPVRGRSSDGMNREVTVLHSPGTVLTSLLSAQSIFSPPMKKTEEGNREEVSDLDSLLRSPSPPTLSRPPAALQREFSLPPVKSIFSVEPAPPTPSSEVRSLLSSDLSTPSPSSGVSSKSSLATPQSPFLFIGSPSPAKGSLLIEFGVKLDFLALMDHNDPASVLAGGLLEKIEKHQEDQAVVCIREYVKLIKDLPNQFYSEVKKLKVNQRFFSDPLDEIKSRPLALQILLGWLHRVNPDEADKMLSDPDVYSLVNQKIEFAPFAALEDDSVSPDLHGYLREGLKNPQTREIAMGLVPKACMQGKINVNNIDEYCDILFGLIAYPRTQTVCIEENRGLLADTLKMLQQVSLPVQRQINRFQSFFFLDTNHLSQAQYRKNSLVGCHEYPQGGRGSYVGERSHIQAVVRYPRLETETGFMAPVTANIKTTKDDCQQKISTFSKVCPDLASQILAIDQVLQKPINDPSQEPEESRRYIGLIDGEARVVFTNNGRSIGTSFVLPFFEIRSRDPQKERRVIPHLKTIDEEGQASRPINHKFSPQKRLFEHIARRREGEPLKPSSSRRALSNQALKQMNQSILATLSQEESPFKIIPTKGEHVLVEMPLSACGIKMRELLSAGYRPSGNSSGKTKRLTDDEITQVFDNEANGLSVILMYPNMSEFTRSFMDFINSDSAGK